MDKIEIEKRSTISEEQTTYILCEFERRKEHFYSMRAKISFPSQ